MGFILLVIRCISHRYLVARTEDRKDSKPFQNARYISANNIDKCAHAVKQSINNAINAHQAVRVVYARDTPACPDWQQKPRNALLKAKHQWLSHHDKKCADLPGYLPLSVGAPVRLTQHLHRATKLKLLKHQQGTVVGWDAHKNEPNPSSSLTVYQHMPCVVYVKFDCEPFQVKGCEPNVYPIRPVSKPWHLDARAAKKKRRRPTQTIKRFQFPITSALGTTIHVAQGDTLDNVIVETAGADQNGMYVALTRVRLSDDIVLTGEFDIRLFQNGPDLLSTMLLKHLRQEDITEDLQKYASLTTSHANKPTYGPRGTTKRKGTNPTHSSTVQQERNQAKWDSKSQKRKRGKRTLNKPKDFTGVRNKRSKQNNQM